MVPSHILPKAACLHPNPQLCGSRVTSVSGVIGLAPQGKGCVLLQHAWLPCMLRLPDLHEEERRLTKVISAVMEVLHAGACAGTCICGRVLPLATASWRAWRTASVVFCREGKSMVVIAITGFPCSFFIMSVHLQHQGRVCSALLNGAAITKF